MGRLKLCILIGLLFAANASAAELPPVIDAYQDDTSVRRSDAPTAAAASRASPSPSRSPSAPQSAATDQRVATLEKQIANLNQTLTQFADLQQQVRDLQGKIDLQKHDLQVLQDQVRTQYQDLDQRLNQKGSQKIKRDKPVDLPTRPVSNATAADSDADESLPPAKANVASTPSDRSAYQEGLNLLKNKKYSQATASFQSFVKKYPHSDDIINARYWLGQLYLLQSQLDRSIDQFRTILKQDPKNSKASDAMLQLGLAYYAKGQQQQAVETLKKVTQQYPDTHAAKSARNRLKQIQPDASISED